jgi:lysophospholipase L1-like esterase
LIRLNSSLLGAIITANVQPPLGWASYCLYTRSERKHSMVPKRTRGLVSLVVVMICCLWLPAGQSSSSIAKPLSGYERMQLWRQSRLSVYLDDFGELSRYRDANAALKPPASGENRAVFYGDSITDGWRLGDYFPGKPYINRGISGQTTSQLLLRVRQDVINLLPKVVIILAGTNDIAGNTGPISDQDIEANYATIAELARLHNIKVVYSSILPVHEYTEEAGDMFAQRPPERILKLNHWLENYCAESSNGCAYLDYFAAMVDAKGHMKRDLSNDGLHPNDAGYNVMAPLAEAAIEKALSSGHLQ